ncbi:response regulator transcription factor [Nonomuraea basaltis]|uniref:response regulator transcription factor n=1 Tax=Nonomuraea basaltis TaxID=2495887 RepID=UPI00110C599A|nr:response regulator transcription factor [Nonomuraea basaltis]TMR91011.1 response regulator transcription factor [Nonomuraea basaltis]
MTIKVVLADDQALVRAGFRALIDSAPDLRVVGEAGDGRQAVLEARRAGADVVLMDIRMPGMDGLAATREITGDTALSQAKVLVLTTFEIDEYVFAALRAGASGFLGKGVEAAELQEAIRVIHRGEALLSRAATKSLIARCLAGPGAKVERTPDELGLLTERERQVMVMVAVGLTNDEIAGELGISRTTAKTHINRTMLKLGAHDRAQLVIIAYETGLVRPRSL